MGGLLHLKVLLFHSRLKEKPWDSPLSRYRVLNCLFQPENSSSCPVLSIMLCDLGELSPWPSFTPCLSSHLSILNTSLFQPFSEPKLWQRRAHPVSPHLVYPPPSLAPLSPWQMYIIIVSGLGNELLFFPRYILAYLRHLIPLNPVHWFRELAWERGGGMQPGSFFLTNKYSEWGIEPVFHPSLFLIFLSFSKLPCEEC